MPYTRNLRHGDQTGDLLGYENHRDTFSGAHKGKHVMFSINDQVTGLSGDVSLCRLHRTEQIYLLDQHEAMVKTLKDSRVLPLE